MEGTGTFATASVVPFVPNEVPLVRRMRMMRGC